MSADRQTVISEESLTDILRRYRSGALTTDEAMVEIRSHCWAVVDDAQQKINAAIESASARDVSGGTNG